MFTQFRMYMYEYVSWENLFSKYSFFYLANKWRVPLKDESPNYINATFVQVSKVGIIIILLLQNSVEIKPSEHSN